MTEHEDHDHADHPGEPCGDPEPPEPEPAEVIDALFHRLGEEGVATLLADCLRATDRARAVAIMNNSMGTLKLSAASDRGRMKRLLVDGLVRRSPAALDIAQSIARDPFEMKADAAARTSLDEAVSALNLVREGQTGASAAGRKKAAAEVVETLCKVVEIEEARRLLLLNAYPDTVEELLAAVESVPAAG